MTHTTVIAECGSSWDCDESKAFRLIEAAKACGADIAKFQWTSNAKAMAERRLGPNAVGPTQMYKRYLEYPLETLMRLKAHCDDVGIEFLVTVYLIEDIATIAPLVKRFKVSAFEATWQLFVNAHHGYGKPVIISLNPHVGLTIRDGIEWDVLHCISEYPTPLEHLKLSRAQLGPDGWVQGFSDHSTSCLTGAVAVGAGATIIEKHIKAQDTPSSNPDYLHSLFVDVNDGALPPKFAQYVSNIREAERAL